MIEKTQPSKKWYLLPLILFLVGPLISVFLIIRLFTSPVSTVTFFIPGTAQIYVAQTGDYTLWMAAHKSTTSEQLVNDFQRTMLTFTNVKTHQAFSLVPKVRWRDDEGDTSHYFLGSLRFTDAGHYQVNAQNQNNRHYKVYLRQPSFMRITKTLLLSAGITLFGVITSVLLAIIIMIKRMNARHTMETIEQKPVNTPPENPSQQAINWAMICHLSGFAGFILPLANIIVPLLIWGFKRQEFPYVDEQGKEAINFQISITIYWIIAAILILIVIGLFIMPLLAAFQIIAMIIASVETAHGKHFRYPLTIRFLR